MKQNKFIIAIIALIGLLTLSAAAQVYPTSLVALTNLPATVATATSSSTTNIVTLPVNGGAALQGVFNVSAGTSNIVMQGSFSADGTNFGTSKWTLIGTANGTTTVVLQTNWSAAQLAGFTALNVTTLTNQNSGTLTNQGVAVNRANYRN